MSQLRALNVLGFILTFASLAHAGVFESATIDINECGSEETTISWRLQWRPEAADVSALAQCEKSVNLDLFDEGAPFDSALCTPATFLIAPMDADDFHGQCQNATQSWVGAGTMLCNLGHHYVDEEDGSMTETLEVYGVFRVLMSDDSSDEPTQDTQSATVTVPSCQGCESETSRGCFDGNVHWFDSCGTQGDLAQICTENTRCDDGACVSTCVPQISRRCSGGDVYWFDSCGEPGSLHQECGPNEVCNVATCVSTCQPRTERRCVGGEVFWFDDCGVRGERFMSCLDEQICSDGVCVNACRPNVQQRCFEGNVHWFDSCGTPGRRIQRCGPDENCTNALCIPSQNVSRTLGDPCDEITRCGLGLNCLLDGEGGGFCTQLCGLGCPPDWNCVQAQTLDEVIEVCIPPGEVEYGQACTASTDCISNFCVGSTDARICSGPCDAEMPCPPGYTCARLNAGGGGCVPASLDQSALPIAETSNETCSDGVDNDGDGFVDCDDFDCSQSLSVSVCDGSQSQENSNETCRDSIDNDGDGAIDCADQGCRLNPNIAVCVEGENSDAACSDGIDNDRDSFIDCDDVNCSQNSNVTICGAAMASAMEAQANSESENTDIKCSDDRDNDGDGLVDCDDSDCRETSTVSVCEPFTLAEERNEACSDGMDNDGDGFVDCEDVSCSRNADVTVCGSREDEANNALCSDGIDNDGDDDIDCEDFSCRGHPDVTVCGEYLENSDESCADGLDNDDDGFVDCEDNDCVSDPEITVCHEGNGHPQVSLQTNSENADALCYDGIDNDGDGQTDCDDDDCRADAVTVCDGDATVQRGMPSPPQGGQEGDGPLGDEQPLVQALPEFGENFDPVPPMDAAKSSGCAVAVQSMEPSFSLSLSLWGLLMICRLRTRQRRRR